MFYIYLRTLHRTKYLAVSPLVHILFVYFCANHAFKGFSSIASRRDTRDDQVFTQKNVIGKYLHLVPISVCLICQFGGTLR
jgi:hypothetical protein